MSEGSDLDQMGQGLGEEIFQDALDRWKSGHDLSQEKASLVMDGLMVGSVSPGMAAALLNALADKGEGVEEVLGMIRSLRRHGRGVYLAPGALDTCGTGGDGAMTFNVSTGAALVAAGAGAVVAKHGNRAASSACGSADVLEGLGVAIGLGAEGVVACVEEAGMGFMLAPVFHPAMKRVAQVRRELGRPTVFNILGPLVNPARVQHQVVGVARVGMVKVISEVLYQTGHKHALVFSGPGGIDELGIAGIARGYEITQAGIREWEIDPSEFGVGKITLDDVRGGDAQDNAEIIRGVLAGEPGPRREVVALNAGAALWVGGQAADIGAGKQLAEEAIDSGAARRVLENLVRVSQRVNQIDR